MELVGLQQAVEALLAHGLPRGAVEVDLRGHQGRQAQQAAEVEPVVHLLRAPPPQHPDELDDGVGEPQLDAGLLAGDALLEGLHLGNQLLKVVRGELVALRLLQEDLGAVHSGLEVARHQGAPAVALDHLDVGARHNDQVFQLIELDHQLGATEHDGNQGQGVAGGQGEPEGQGHVQGFGLLGVGNELLPAVGLANHFRQALAGLARQLLPRVQVLAAQLVHGLGADDEGHPLHNGEAHRVGPVAPGVLVARGRRGAAARVGGAVPHKVPAGAVLLKQPRVGAAVHRGEVLGVCHGTGAVGVQGVGELLGGAAGAGPGRAGPNAGNLQHDVQIIQQVAGLVNFAARRVTKGHLGVKGLHNGQHRKVGVLQVPEAPEGQGGLSRQQGRHGAACRQLQQGAVGGQGRYEKRLGTG